MTTKFTYRFVENVDINKKYKNFPPNSEFSTEFGLKIQIQKNINHSKLSIIFLEEELRFPLPSLKQSSLLAQSAVNKIWLIEDWKKILFRTKASVGTKNRKIFVEIENINAEFETDELKDGFYEFLNLLLIKALFYIFPYEVEIININAE